MLRLLLFGVLSLGVARLAWTLAREPRVLDALSGEPSARRFEEQDFAPLVERLAAIPPDEEVFVLAPDGSAFAWIRYLAYPRRIVLAPLTGPEALEVLPAGTSWVVLPEARAGDDASLTLRARAGARAAERVLARDGAFALYRIER